jgi:hypothetical protein
VWARGEAPWWVMGPWGPVKPGLERKPSIGGLDGPTRSGLKTHCVIVLRISEFGASNFWIIRHN